MLRLRKPVNRPTYDGFVSNAPAIASLNWSATPLEIAARWPADEPLMMLHSGGGGPWGRWSILARPREVRRSDDLAGLDWIDVKVHCTSRTGDEAPIPFCGGWIGYLSYDLGRVIEPRAATMKNGGDCESSWPLMELAWCPDALVFDHLERRWWCVGEVPEMSASESATRGGAALPLCRGLGGDSSVGELRSNFTPDGYLDAVNRTLEYIRAGDIFQANIAQRFAAEFHGDARAFALHALAVSGARYGACLELGSEDASGPRQRDLISLSPELFLQFDPATRSIVTRPIKGTRPTLSQAGAERRDAPGRATDLLHSEKDAAELHMIVDLMRNDLGRVCEFGSVRVVQPRMIETHPTVHHGVAEVIGRMREEVSPGGLIRAAFPPGSVTGAPKIRAMQIIDGIEPTRRGPYCGAIGYFSLCGRMTLNVAIRTILLNGSDLSYSAGCGIVADSDPLSEYRESLDKAAVLRAALRVGEVVGV